MSSRANISVTRKSLQHDVEKPPEKWPNDIIYLTDLVYSGAISHEQRMSLCRPSSGLDPWMSISRQQITTTLDRVKIGLISDERHPAFGQRALLAKTTLDPDSFVTLYLGVVHNNTASDTDADSDYDLSFDSALGLSIDASKRGNIARFANDYRGISFRPNAEFRDCFVKVYNGHKSPGPRWERRVGIFVLPAGKSGKRNSIHAGQEVLINYGKPYWEARKLSIDSRGRMRHPFSQMP